MATSRFIVYEYRAPTIDQHFFYKFIMRYRNKSRCIPELMDKVCLRCYQFDAPRLQFIRIDEFLELTVGIVISIIFFDADCSSLQDGLKPLHLLQNSTKEVGTC
jgi:hypothetical protein